jgi:hypothetical protein
MAQECQVEKPICFRTEYRGTTKKKIVFRCNGEPYDVLEALKNAYEIKTNADVNARNPDRVDQCKPINDPKADPNADCSCLNFDFAWMTAINVAKSRIEEVNPNDAKPPTAEETKQIQKLVDDVKGKLKIYTYFEEISKSMRNNLKINNGVNVTEITTFCDLIDRAIQDANDTTKEKAVEAAATQLLAELDKPDYIKNDQIENQFIYMVVYYFCYLDKNMDATPEPVLSSIPPVDNLQEVAPSSNEEPVGQGKNDFLNDIKSIYHVGTYVIDNSIHFDNNAFKATRDLFKNLYLTYFTSKNPNSGGGEQNGGTFRSRLAFAAYKLKGWAKDAGNFLYDNPIKSIVMVLAVFATALFVPILLPVVFIGNRAIAYAIDEKKKLDNTWEPGAAPDTFSKFDERYQEKNKNCDLFKTFIKENVKPNDIILWRNVYTGGSGGNYYSRVVSMNNNKIQKKHIWLDMNNYPDNMKSAEETSAMGDIPITCDNKIADFKYFKIIKNTMQDFKNIQKYNLLVANINAKDDNNNLIMKRKIENNPLINNFYYKKNMVYEVTKIIKSNDTNLGIELRPMNPNEAKEILLNTNPTENNDTGQPKKDKNSKFCLYHPDKNNNEDLYVKLFTLIVPYNDTVAGWKLSGGGKNKKHTKKKLRRRKKNMTRR